jgi:hypothetical protein
MKTMLGIGLIMVSSVVSAETLPITAEQQQNLSEISENAESAKTAARVPPNKDSKIGSLKGSGDESLEAAFDRVWMSCGLESSGERPYLDGVLLVPHGLLRRELMLDITVTPKEKKVELSWATAHFAVGHGVDGRAGALFSSHTPQVGDFKGVLSDCRVSRKECLNKLSSTIVKLKEDLLRENIAESGSMKCAQKLFEAYRSYLVKHPPTQPQ